MCRNLCAAIVEQVNGCEACQHWSEHRKCFLDGGAEPVDWTATEDAVKASPRSGQIWAAKQAAGASAPGKAMLCRKKRDTVKCPRCDCEVEDGEHILRCEGPSAWQAWTKANEMLKLSLPASQTAADMVSALCEGSSSRCGETPQLDMHCSDDVRAALSNQDSIGWQSALEGCPAMGWAEAQQGHCGRWQSKRRVDDGLQQWQLR